MEPDQVVAGIDWARDDHAVAVVDAAGRVVERFTVAHTAAGLRVLVSRLRHHRAREVAIERPDGQVVETMLAAGLTVVVISPNQVKNLRSRYGQTGNKDDRFDAFVLADTLRTDRARLRTLTQDTPATITLRAAVRARKDLVHHRVALANQLRAHLHAFYPAPVGLFHELDGQMSIKFLTRFDCQDRADWLTPKRLAAFLAGIRYCGSTTAEKMHARITAAPRGATGDVGAAAVHVTRALLTALRALVEQIDVLTDQITEQLHAHTDAHVFTNLPRAGTVHAARLLAEIGDARGRFPTPEALASLAGVAPSTRQSGKSRVVGFPAEQPVGRRHLPPRSRPRSRPSPRGAGPGPGLGLRDLALLARRCRLRPGPARRLQSSPRRGVCCVTGPGDQWHRGWR